MTSEGYGAMQVPTNPPATPASGVIDDTKPRVLLMGNKRYNLTQHTLEHR